MTNKETENLKLFGQKFVSLNVLDENYSIYKIFHLILSDSIY